ncbi:hypothetical protein ES705_29545 [subsurface metagenome]
MKKEIRNLKMEIRNLKIEQSEIRTDPKTGIISGYAMVFNSLSELIYGRFREKILPEAMKGVIKKSDVLALLDHQRIKGVLARSRFGKGTLTLTIDDKGLRYQFTPPKTALGKEAQEYLKRGDIQGSSFHFVLADKGDTWEKSTDGKYIRTITKFSELHDISLAFKPAYPETTAAIRSLEAFEKKKKPKPKLSRKELKKFYQNREKQMGKKRKNK